MRKGEQARLWARSPRSRALFERARRVIAAGGFVEHFGLVPDLVCVARAVDGFADAFEEFARDVTRPHRLILPRPS